MKISREWLLEFVDFSDLSEGEYSDLISTRVAEVEECYQLGEPFSYAIVAKILSVSSHPSKESLSILNVHTGSETVQVVCGASNVREGAFVAYVPPGGKIRKGEKAAEDEELIEIEVREVQGIKSCGVLLSESELGLSTNHDGIILLDETCPEKEYVCGKSLGDHISGKDIIIDIDNKSLTHRPDLWSHFGFALEISTILKRPLKKDLHKLTDFNDTLDPLYNEYLTSQKSPSPYSITIEGGSSSSRFSVLLLTNLVNGRSPLWVRRRLFAVGAGVRNILVDASNYILHECGQPNHAYDVRRIVGKEFFVRRARDGEAFKGLDLLERSLEHEDIVISDKDKTLALAGIIGGHGCSVEEDTSEVLLESANFDPVKVRQSCKKYQLRTDSSNRFEKSLSPYQVPLAPIRYIELLKRIGLKPEIPNAWSDSFPIPPDKISIPYRPQYIQQRLGGVPESEDEIKGILERLKFTIDKDIVHVPYHRAGRDISLPEDLVEEVGRIIGYEKVPEKAPLIHSSGSGRSLIGSAELTCRLLLSAQGFTEVYNDTFSSQEECESLGYDMIDAISLLNPVDHNESIVQTSLIPSLLNLANRNHRNFSSMACFEIGRCYHVLPESISDKDKASSDDPSEGVKERRMVSVLLSVPKSESLEIGNPQVSKGLGFYSLRTLLSRLVAELSPAGSNSGGVNNGELLELLPLEKVSDLSSDQKSERTRAQDFKTQKAWMHPFRAASLQYKGLTVGVMAEVRPRYFDSKSERLILAEVDIEAILATYTAPVLFNSINKFPDSFFEISLVIDKRELFSSIKDTFLANIGDIPLKSLEPVSVYEGKPLSESEKSLSIRFIFGKDDSTISAEELEGMRSKVLSVIDRSKYRLRA